MPETPPEPRGDAKRVMVCDDDESLVDILSTLLEAQGYRVSSAHDGPSCFDVFEAETPDLLILDLNLPIQNGFVVLEKLRDREKAGNTHLVMLSADERPADREMAERLGVHRFVAKPFDCSELLEYIAETLAKPNG